MRAAIVAVHGVCPHARYEIQDAFALGLCGELNRRNYLNAKWYRTILWPTTKAECSPGDLHALAVRVEGRADDARSDLPVFDVFEGYWSPIDKNQTTVAKVLSWLLSSIFAPLNGFAKLWSSRKKIAFDLGYVGTAIAVIAVLFTGFLGALFTTWRVFVVAACRAVKCESSPSFTGVVFHPSTALASYGWAADVLLLLNVVGAYLAWSFAFSVVMDAQRWIWRRSPSAMLIVDPSSRTSWRHIFQAALMAVSVAAFVGSYAVASYNNLKGASFVAALGLVVSLGLLKAALALAQGFLINFLGDVQIYCTHDENAAFFQLRQKIQAVVEEVVLQVLRSSANPPGEAFEPYYDRVFIAAHSLGSSISMDAILNLHEMTEEDGLEVQDWRRLRGFMTFGTSLEKTRFFFDVRDPSFSASYAGWRDDVSGHLFTPDPSALRQNSAVAPVGIYWANYWYEKDIVANQIQSYRSTINPGDAIPPRSLRRNQSPRVVCQNARLKSRFFRPLFHIWVHGDYLGDAAFWSSGVDADGKNYEGIADVVTS